MTVQFLNDIKLVVVRVERCPSSMKIVLGKVVSCNVVLDKHSTPQASLNLCFYLYHVYAVDLIVLFGVNCVALSDTG